MQVDAMKEQSTPVSANGPVDHDMTYVFGTDNILLQFRIGRFQNHIKTNLLASFQQDFLMFTLFSRIMTVFFPAIDGDISSRLRFIQNHQKNQKKTKSHLAASDSQRKNLLSTSFRRSSNRNWRGSHLAHPFSIVETPHRPHEVTNLESASETASSHRFSKPEGWSVSFSLLFYHSPQSV